MKYEVKLSEWIASLSILIGVLHRASRILSMVSIIKLFVIILAPEAVVENVKELYENLSQGNLLIDGSLVIYYSFFIAIFFQLLYGIISIIKLNFSLKMRRFVWECLVKENLDNKKKRRLYNTIVKHIVGRHSMFEIIIFFTLLFVLFLWISLMYSLVFLILTPVFGYVVYMLRKYFHNNIGFSKIPGFMKFKSKAISSMSISLLASFFLIGMIFIYFFLDIDSGVSGYLILIMAFGSRMLIGFVNEFIKSLYDYRSSKKELNVTI